MQNGRHFYLILFIYFSKIGKPINFIEKTSSAASKPKNLNMMTKHGYLMLNHFPH
jgi:hypothetical protein